MNLILQEKDQIMGRSRFKIKEGIIMLVGADGHPPVRVSWLFGKLMFVN